MPVFYKRKTYPKKKFVRRPYRGTMRRKYMGATTRLPTRELKYSDSYSTGDVAVTNTGTITSIISPIVKGTEQYQRVGDSITIKRIFLRGTLSGKQGAPETDPFYNNVRILIIQDKQGNGVAPALADILMNPTYMINSPINMGNAWRFNVLMDKVIQVDYDDPQAKLTRYIKTNIPVHWAYNDADPITNNVYFVVVSDQPDDYPMIGWYIRTRYTDN